MLQKDFTLFSELTCYTGASPKNREQLTVSGNGIFDGQGYRVSWDVSQEGDSIIGTVRFSFSQPTSGKASVCVGIRQSGWKKGNYLLMPGAVYNGNRFPKLDVKYPPFVPEGLRKKGCGEGLITDIPKLSDTVTQSKIQLLSGDLSCPMIAWFDEAEDIGCILQTVHQTSLGYSGLFFQEDLTAGEAELRICAPGVREETFYRMTDTQAPSDDEGVQFQAGDHAEIPFALHYFKCGTVSDLFRAVFSHRYDMEPPAVHPAVVPFSQAFAAISDRFETSYFDPADGFYGLGEKKGRQFWQTGWVGGGMAGYPLLKHTSPSVRQHVLETLAFLFTLQNKNGWLAPIYWNGMTYGDSLKFFTGEPETDADKNILLIRKNADALYFILRQLEVLQQEGHGRPELETKAKRLCDAFVRLWKANGQLGQFMDTETEKILIPGSAAGAVAGAALVTADRMFGGYLTVAEEITRYYCQNYLEKGILTGGPGEILQCPDSESAFGLLESCVELAVHTGKTEWECSAVKAAHHAASWVMSYDFHFPAGSTNARFAMGTCGTVFANAQNKHSAPGICTLSGDSLLKLYRITHDPAFLRLLTEITGGLMQYVQTAQRLIPTITDKHPTPGCVCERVQTSDWEGKEAVGEILAPTSVWPEVSALLTCAEIPGIYLDPANRQLAVFDHLEAAINWEKSVLNVYNPTLYDAEFDILIDDEGTGICHCQVPSHTCSSIDLTLSE